MAAVNAHFISKNVYKTKQTRIWHQMKLLGEKKTTDQKGSSTTASSQSEGEREREGAKTEIKENGYDNSDNGSLDRK